MMRELKIMDLTFWVSDVVSDGQTIVFTDKEALRRALAEVLGIPTHPFDARTAVVITGREGTNDLP